MVTRSSKKKAISVNFSDTESQGTLPEGDYLLEVDEVEQKTSENSGNDYLAITFKVAEGQYKGKKVWHNCSLQPQALFNLRGVLEALGFEVPQGVMDLDPADMLGEICGGTVNLETYEGKKKARVTEFFHPDELNADSAPAAEPEKEEPAPKATKKPVAKKEIAKAQPNFAVGNNVNFTDEEGDELMGKITALDDYTATVKVGKEQWEISRDDLTLA